MEEKERIIIVGNNNGIDTFFHIHPDMVEKEIELHFTRRQAPTMMAAAGAMAMNHLSKSENKVASMSDHEILRHYEQIKSKSSKLSSTERKMITVRAEKIINQNQSI